MTDHLMLREATVEGFLGDACNPEFDSPEALAKWRTRRIYLVIRRAAAWWEPGAEVLRLFSMRRAGCPR